MALLPSEHMDMLFGRAREGDSPCLDEYCRMIREGLIQIATFRLPGWSRQAIEDIVQDVLVVFVQRIDEITGSPTAFVRGVLYNKIGNELQRLGAQGKPLAIADPESSVIEYALTQRPQFVQDTENRDTVAKCVAVVRGMEEPCRALLLGLLEGSSVAELWAETQRTNAEISRAAFDRRLYVCRRRLLSLMGVQL